MATINPEPTSLQPTLRHHYHIAGDAGCTRRRQPGLRPSAVQPALSTSPCLFLEAD